MASRIAALIVFTALLIGFNAKFVHAAPAPPTLQRYGTAIDAYAVNLARRTFTKSPCSGREDIQVMGFDDLNTPALRSQHGTTLGGYAFMGTCSVVIAGDVDPTVRCMVILHELGHIAGYRHDQHPYVKDKQDVPETCLDAGLALLEHPRRWSRWALRKHELWCRGRFRGSLIRACINVVPDYPLLRRIAWPSQLS